MLVYCKFVSGTTTAVEVPSGATVAELRALLATRSRVAGDCLALALGGKQLPEGSALSSVGIRHGTMVNALLRMRGGPSVDLEVGSESYVSDVKLAIEDSAGIPYQDQILIFNGERLEDDMSLGDYGIFSPTQLNLVVPLVTGKTLASRGPRSE
jgi:Ubiquitin family